MDSYILVEKYKKNEILVYKIERRAPGVSQSFGREKMVGGGGRVLPRNGEWKREWMRKRVREKEEGEREEEPFSESWFRSSKFRIKRARLRVSR